MSISIVCEDCSSKYSVPEEHAGKRTKCKKCGSLMTIPALDEGASDEGAEPPARPSRKKTVERSQRSQRSAAGRSRRSRSEEGEPAGPALPPIAIIAGLVVALLGAGAWLLILTKFELEIGWLAIGIGAATGAAMVKFGGRGVVAGVVAAALTAAAMVGARVAGLNLIFEGAVVEAAAAPQFQDEFKELRGFGREVAKMEHPLTVASVKEYAQEFEHDYGDPMSPAEIVEFKGQMLEWEAYAKKGGYTQYKEEVVVAIKEGVTTGDLIKEAFGPKDLIFLALAIAAAFGMVRSKS